MGTLPKYGTLFLSCTFACFLANWPSTLKLVIALSDIKDIRQDKVFFSSSIKITTISNKVVSFSTFSSCTEVFKLLQRLTNFAMNELLLEDGVNKLGSLDIKNESESKKLQSRVRRSLDAHTRVGIIKSYFNLPLSINFKYDSRASLVLPYEKQTMVEGRLYIWDAFFTFTCKKRLVKLIIPAGDVSNVDNIGYAGENFLRDAILMHSHDGKCHIFTNILKMKQALDFVVDVLDKYKMEQEKKIHSDEDEIEMAAPLVKDLNKPSDVDFVESFQLTEGSSEERKNNRRIDQMYQMELLKNDWMQHFEKYGRGVAMYRNTELLKLLIKGIHPSLRREMWMTMTSACVEMQMNKGLYVKILNNSSVETSVSYSIDRDVDRSLPEHPAYQSKEGIDRLRTLLNIYAWKTPKIGYCQSMNFLGSIMLLYLNPEESMWLLACVCERMLRDYYSCKLIGALIDMEVFKEYLNRFLPALYLVIVDMDLLHIYIMSWFLSLFNNVLSFRLTLRILDVFFYDGVRVLFMLALSILTNIAPKLLQCDSEESYKTLKDFLNSIGLKNDHNSTSSIFLEDLLRDGYSKFKSITMQEIESLRMKNQIGIVQTIEKNTVRVAVRSLMDYIDLSKNLIEKIYLVYRDGLVKHRKVSPESQTTHEKYNSTKPYYDQNRIEWKQFETLIFSVFRYKKFHLSTDMLASIFRYYDRDEDNEINLLDFVYFVRTICYADATEKLSFLYATSTSPSEKLCTETVAEMNPENEKTYKSTKSREKKGHYKSVNTVKLKYVNDTNRKMNIENFEIFCNYLQQILNCTFNITPFDDDLNHFKKLIFDIYNTSLDNCQISQITFQHVQASLHMFDNLSSNLEKCIDIEEIITECRKLYK